LVNNGGYGAVISSLQAGIPMVLAGEGQDKNLTNAIVAWKEVGVNLGRMNPSVGEVHDAVTEVLKATKYKRNAAAMSREFGKYDMGTVFDSVIQSVIRKWQEKKR
jgi:UDP:flavonoid glycosyltransferase YjiC (YdhE family)